MGRGMLSTSVKQKSAELFGEELSVRELRLMPFINDRLMNFQGIKPQQVNQEELEILTKWRDKGYITEAEGETGSLLRGAKMVCTREFFIAMNEILWISYVAKVDD